MTSTTDRFKHPWVTVSCSSMLLALSCNGGGDGGGDGGDGDGGDGDGGEQHEPVSGWETIDNPIAPSNLGEVFGNGPDDVYLGDEVHWDGERLHEIDTGLSFGVGSFWSFGADDFVAVSMTGGVAHFLDGAWAEIALPEGDGSELEIVAVSGTSPSDLFGVGWPCYDDPDGVRTCYGMIWHFDGSGWSQVFDGQEGDGTYAVDRLSDVWTVGPSETWAVGDFEGQFGGAVFVRWDGSTWEVQAWGADEGHALWGFGTGELYAVGAALGDMQESDLFVASYDGASWHDDGPLPVHGADWSDIWGTNGGNLYVAGGSGAIAHFDGSEWSAMDSGTTEFLYGVGGGGPNDVFVVGMNGLVLRGIPAESP